MTLPDEIPSTAAATLTALGGLRLNALGDEEGAAQLFAALAADKVTATATIAGLVIVVSLLAGETGTDLVDWTSSIIDRLSTVDGRG